MKSSLAELGSAVLSLLPRSLMALGEGSGALHVSPAALASFPVPFQGRSDLHPVVPKGPVALPCPKKADSFP